MTRRRIKPRVANWKLGRKMWDKDVPQVQIARALGVTQQRVSRKAKDDAWPIREKSLGRSGVGRKEQA